MTTPAKQQLFDSSCYDLAESALPSAAKYGLKAALATAIHECISDWLDSHKVILQRELGPNWESEL
jgi:hypothetical protein